MGREISTDISEATNSVKSWSNCMAFTYCKWPVLIGIAVVGLMVLSIVTCIIRCACCGMSCCCSCFSFLKCCDCIGGCCDGKKNKPHKYLDNPGAAPPPNQGYQPPSPMMTGGLRKEPPQYAAFEVGKNGLAVEPKAQLSEDALPPMPSWETATKKRVVDDDEKDGMELGQLDPATGQKMQTNGNPSPTSRSPTGRSPTSPVNGNGYMDGANDPYGQYQNGYHQNSRGYASPQTGPSRFGSPAPSYAPQLPRYASPAPQASYHGYDGNMAQDGYSDSGYGGSSGFANGQYGGSSPQREYQSGSARQYMGDQYNNRMPPPARGPSRGPGGPNGPVSPLQNNGGFDFGGRQQQQQYDSRPLMPSNRMEQQQTGYFDHASTPAPQEQATYSGYQSYQPGSRNQAMTPGGSGRQPDRWDPVNHY